MNCQDEESDHPIDSSQANEMSSSEKNCENVTIVNYENESVVNYSENEGILNYGDNENDYNYDENETELNYDENEPELNYEDDNDIPLSYDEIEAELNSGDNQIAQRYEGNESVQNYDENETAQNYEETEINCDEVEAAQNYCKTDSAQNFVDKDLEINEKMPEDDLTEPYKTTSNETNSILDKTFYGDPQDDEYAQELEESLDQITSLDIIDRIEQSLMDQLQKEDPFEVCIFLILSIQTIIFFQQSIPSNFLFWEYNTLCYFYLFFFFLMLKPLKISLCASEELFKKYLGNLRNNFQCHYFATD